MPRCIVPGCTSGYDSNKGKVHKFKMPKDENIAKLWQAAIRRKDLIIKRQVICERHFLPSDLQWYRELCDDKGNVLGIVSISHDMQYISIKMCYILLST